MNFLSKKIIDFSGDSFGLDINDLSVKILQIKKEGNLERISSFGLIDIPITSIIDGEIKEPEVVASKIKELIKKAKPNKIKTKKVTCSLPEEKAFLRLINVPKMKKSEIGEAIKWEIEANIPLTVEQVYYDYQLLSENFSKDKNKMSVLFLAIARDVVDQFLGVAESAGLEVMSLEVESVAQARSLLGKEDEKKTSLIVDLGGRKTSFLFAVKNIPSFTSSIHVSSQSLTDVISKGLNVSMKEAEKIKIENGIGSAIKGDPIFNATKPVVENLISEIEKSVDFFLTGLGYSEAVDQIIICGGGANTKGLIPYLSKRLKRKVVIGNPWKNLNMGKNLPIIKKEKSIQYSTALGLALRGTEDITSEI